MTAYLSEKIRSLSFFSMVLVVFLHGQLISISSGYVLWIQQFVSGELTRIAVPLFFVISGYLFFQNFSMPLIPFFQKKIQKRIYTLLIPYLFWSIFGIVSLYVIQQILPVSFFSSKNLIANYDIQEILYAIFIQPVGAYQLWFLRDLFILVIFSPVIYWGIKHVRIFFLLGLFFLWINGIQYFVSIESIFFFTVGAYIALRYKDCLEAKHLCPFAYCLLVCVWVVYCSVLAYYKLGYSYHCLGVLLGIIVVWYSYDGVYSYLNRIKKLQEISTYSFFVYVTHEPLLTGIKKILLSISSSSSSVILIIYFFAPLITIFISLIIGKFFRMRIPKIYHIISGGR